jgi:restriction system protein
LAIDKKNKEFVVIELKKGRNSDAVIGQILRYMGWVTDKSAGSAGYFNVRGIIIAKEKE